MASRPNYILLMIRSRMSKCESDIWSKSSQTIESGEGHLGALETSQDECSETCEMITGDGSLEMNHGRKRQSVMLYDDIEVM